MKIETEMISRPVVDGERLSGHGDEATGYPEIHVSDKPDGSLLFTIGAFHWADVAVRGDVTELFFEGRRVVLSDAFVEYGAPK